jgi:4-amino-4-deoxy-L-arabinose transferase-like glycosyltransferase
MKKHLPIIVFLSIFFFLIASKLIFQPTPFYDWDESIYIQAGKEMIAHKSFLTPMWQGTYWLDKPPLIPLVYGLIAKLTFLSTPEITTRFFNLLVTILVLSFVYIFYNKVLKDRWLSTLTVAITAFTPLFLQRAQTVNLDVFILIGWFGYIIFFNNFFIGLFLLFIGVMAKSLIGFYPVILIVIYNIYRYFKKEIKIDKLKKITFKIFIQVGILSLWYLLMFIVFKKDFFWQHIIESHFRRVTSSIEFHFGTRIFYLTFALEQMGYFFWLGIFSGILYFLQFLKNKVSSESFLVIFFLLPWFVFLNLTKTKIFWYFFPAIPLFAFLSVSLVKQIKIKSLKIIFGILLLGVLFYQSFIKQEVLKTIYSKPETYLELSLYAKDKCRNLNFLINKTSRESFDTLDKLGLLITTTKWWGDHPSMVYYFSKKINFYYDTVNFDKSFMSNGCFVIDKEDSNYLNAVKRIKQFGNYYLVIK